MAILMKTTLQIILADRCKVLNKWDSKRSSSTMAVIMSEKKRTYDTKVKLTCQD